MKKVIIKCLVFALLLGFMWSCSSENDVQMQSSDSNVVTQKDGNLLDGQIGVDLGGGVYQITVDKGRLLSELNQASAEIGTPAKYETVEIRLERTVNNPAMAGFVLVAGTASTSEAVTLSGNLTSIGGSFYLGNPSAGGGKGFTTCRGCPTGCFLEYYDIDGHYLAYCDSAGCGNYCYRKVTKK